MELTIDYCDECGHLDKAVEIAREVMEEYSESFDSVELIPSENGVLRVSIESEVVFDLDEEEFSISDIKQKVSDHLEGRE
jgi:selenoprotein W-related protein